MNKPKLNGLGVENLESRWLMAGVNFFGGESLTVVPKVVEGQVVRPVARITMAAAAQTEQVAKTPVWSKFLYTDGVKIRPEGTRKDFPNRKPYVPPVPTPLPAPTGMTRDVTLTIGEATSKTQNRLGVNIGELTAYAQNNLTSNILTQIGTFERANGLIMMHAGTGSTTSKLHIKDPWLFSTIGVETLVGAKIESVNGANSGLTATITAAAKRTDASGGTYVEVTLDRTWRAAANGGDSFVATVLGYGSTKLAENVYVGGSASVVRDSSVAHGGASSAKIGLGGGNAASNIVQLQNYFGADNTAGRNVLRQGHTYEVSFWARVMPGSGTVTSKLSLYQGNNGGTSQHTLVADGAWHKYTTTVTANNAVKYENGIASFYFSGSNATVNVDDLQIVDLTDQQPGAPALSADVVRLIKEYNFGELRFWQPSLRPARFDDLIGAPKDRPAILNLYNSYDPQFGLPEMLELCRQTGTTPWITLSTAWTKDEIRKLMEYLGGDASTTYGAKRAADGQVTPWTEVLAGIRLEAGNESWNGTF